MNSIKPLFASAKGARVSSKHLLILISLLSALLSCGNNPVDDIDEGTLTDIDGNVYKTVKIGNQVWTVENLRTTKYYDGTDIPQVTDSAEWVNLSTGAYCYYDNDISNKEKYGALYNWYTVKTGKLAPDGWHVPTDAEWTQLENYLVINGYNWDGTTDTTVRNKIGKSIAAKTDWDSSSIEGTVGNVFASNNSSGFSALPGGARHGSKGSFYLQGHNGLWWSTMEFGATWAYHRNLGYNIELLYRGNNPKVSGFSVRLVKD